MPSVIEICAGAGGQALGLERAGFSHSALVEIDNDACATLSYNRPTWPVINADIKTFSAKGYFGIDLLAGGVPCQPFSLAGKQLGQRDERDLFPEVIRIVAECRPSFILIENVPGLATKRLADYLQKQLKQFKDLGYNCEVKTLSAVDFGLPQKRSRFIIVGISRGITNFNWPQPTEKTATVAETIGDLLSIRGFDIQAIKKTAATFCPCIVGGSKKHGGADLGPTRAKKEWESLGIDATGIADEPPSADHNGRPRLTLQMVARFSRYMEILRPKNFSL